MEKDSPQKSQPSLLLVDGDPQSRRVLEVSLRKAGYVVTAAPAAADALAKIEALNPDLVITDTQLHDATGLDLCERLRADSRWQTLPLMMLSGDATLDERVRSIEIGVDEYLGKPIFIKEIVARMELLLRRSRRRRLVADGATSFDGNLADLTVIDLIQTLEVARKSATVSLSRGKIKASISFAEGQLADARVEKLEGPDAVYRLLTWSQGLFSVQFAPFSGETTIHEANQAVLLEGLRRLDEWGWLVEAQLPPVDAVFQLDFQVLAQRIGEIPDEVNSVLRLVDGQRTVQDIVDEGVFGDVEALSILAKLFGEGMIQTAPSSADLEASLDPDGVLGVPAAASIPDWVGDAEALSVASLPPTAALAGDGPAPEEVAVPSAVTDLGTAVEDGAATTPGLAQIPPEAVGDVPPFPPFEAFADSGDLNAMPPVSTVELSLPTEELQGVEADALPPISTEPPNPPTPDGGATFNEPDAADVDALFAVDQPTPNEASEPSPAIINPEIEMPAAFPLPDGAIDDAAGVIDAPPPLDEPLAVPPLDEALAVPPLDEALAVPPLDEALAVPPLDEPLAVPPLDEALAVPPLDEALAVPPLDEALAVPPLDEALAVPPLDEALAVPPLDEALAVPPLDEALAVPPLDEGPSSPATSGTTLVGHPAVPTPVSEVNPDDSEPVSAEPLSQGDPADTVDADLTGKPGGKSQATEDEIDRFLADDEGEEAAALPKDQTQEESEAKPGGPKKEAGLGGKNDASIDVKDENFFSSDYQEDDFTEDHYPAGRGGQGLKRFVIAFAVLGGVGAAAGYYVMSTYGQYLFSGDATLEPVEHGGESGKASPSADPVSNKERAPAKNAASISSAPAKPATKPSPVKAPPESPPKVPTKPAAKVLAELPAKPAPVKPAPVKPAPKTALAESGRPPAKAAKGYSEIVAQANAALEKGQSKKAYRIFAKANKLDPTGWQALEQLAVEAMERGKMSRALALARRAQAANPDAPYSQLVIGSALGGQAGQKAASMAAYRKFLKLCPSCRFAKDIRSFVK